MKGAIAGFAWVAVLFFVRGYLASSYLLTVAALLALPAVTAYYTLNFTGCTNFTSPSGVKKEMRIAVPVMCGAVVLSIILLLIDWLIRHSGGVF